MKINAFEKMKGDRSAFCSFGWLLSGWSPLLLVSNDGPKIEDTKPCLGQSPLLDEIVDSSVVSLLDEKSLPAPALLFSTASFPKGYHGDDSPSIHDQFCPVFCSSLKSWTAYHKFLFLSRFAAFKSSLWPG